MTDLSRLTKMCEVLVARKEALLEAEVALAQQKHELTLLEREDIPAMMAELGITELKLASGQRIQVKEDVDCKITDFNRDKALTWLIEHGYGGIIKTEVSVNFGRGERDKAQLLAADILEHTIGQDVAVVETVHPSTLKAFVRERLMAGDAIPMDIFSVVPYATTKITK